jgi:hypothetical protein
MNLDAVPSMGRSNRRDLCLVYCVALGIRLVWAALVPPWVGPDEMQHFTYVAHIIDLQEIPSPGPSTTQWPWNSNEDLASCRQTFCDRISGLTSGNVPALDHLPVVHDYREAREFTGSAGDRLTQAGGEATWYPPPYYLFSSLFYGAFFSAPVLTRLMAARAATALLSSLACCFGYLLAREISGRTAWGRALGLSMALFPMLSFLGACVNNDAALMVSATALCWLSAQAIRMTPVTMRHVVLMGVAAGAVLLSKPTGLPVVVFATLVLLWRCPPLIYGPLRIERSGLKLMLSFAAIVLLSEGPWLLFRYLMASGGQYPVAAETAALGSLADHASHSFPSYLASRAALGFTYFRWFFFKSSWALFGWQEIALVEPVYDAISIVCLIGLAGVALRFIGQPSARSWSYALIGANLLQLLFLFVVVDYLISFRVTGKGFNLQGRYMLPVLAPFLFLLLSGWSRVLRDRAFAVWVVPVGMMVLQIVSLLRLLTGYYALRFG